MLSNAELQRDAECSSHLISKVATKNDLYEADFYAWTQRQAELLRERRWVDLDLENLVEEVEAVRRSNNREIQSRPVVLFAHLLKCKYQQALAATVGLPRSGNSAMRLRASSRTAQVLQHYPAERILDEYDGARLRNSKETGIAYGLLPEQCRSSIEGVLDPDFLPEEPGHLVAGSD